MSLENKDIENGFWNIKNRKPEFLNFESERIYKVKNLGLGFVNEQNKSEELKIWNKRFEQLDNVEYIWTYHELNQSTLEAICGIKNLKGINIKWSSIKDLECLKDKNGIEHLNLGLSTDIETIKPICNLRKLITLESENLKKVRDWKSIANLKQLEGLVISGGMNEKLKLETIDFLSELTELKYLFLISTKICDSSLKPIEKLKKLESLKLTNDWQKEDFISLKNILPKLKFGNVANDKQTIYLEKIFRK